MSENTGKNTKLASLLGLIFLLVCGGLVWGLSDRISETPSQTEAESFGLEGKIAPAFTLKNLKGEPVSLADYRGKVVFLNFWATWCEPCKKEMPSMQNLRATMQGKPFEILAVSLDNNPVKAVPDFAQKTGLNLNFPVLQDPEQTLAKTSYQTTGVPESFLINAEGKVVKHVIGSFEWDSPQIVNYFEELIEKPDGNS